MLYGKSQLKGSAVKKIKSLLRVCVVFLLLIILFQSSGWAGSGKACKVAANEVAYPKNKWLEAEPCEVGLKADQLIKVDEFLKGFGDSSGLVIRKGKIAHAWGDINKQYDIASSTKVFTSTAIGLAIDDKKISLDDKAYKYISEITLEKDKQITIAHLLSMTSEYGREGLPGETWFYSHAVELLSQVIDAEYNMSMASFVRIRIMEPIGATNWRWLASEDPNGNFMTLSGWGLNISSSDIARLGYLFLHEGIWDNKRLISKQWIDISTRTSQELKSDYGFLWWVNEAGDWPDVPEDSYCAFGRGARDILFVCPSLDLIAVRLGGESLIDTVNLPVFLKLVVECVEDEIK